MLNETVIFWSAVALLGYTYIGYPLLIRAWAELRKRGASTSQPALSREPLVSLLVVAHNEESRIEARIENLLALDYPRSRLEIVIASDASTDQTVKRALAYRKMGLRIVEFTAHRGKPAVLNELIPGLRGEIVVLIDVRQRIESGALRALVSNFSDPGIGAVSGELFLEDEMPAAAVSEVGQGVGFYWRYEKFIRLQEARVDSTVGVTGALYAIRRRLFERIPDTTVLDDVLIPMKIVRQGYRVLFEPSARAYDRISATAQVEFARKVRTIAGNYQLLFRQPWLMNPLANRLWLQTVSHKLCRLLGPFCLGVVLLTNLLMLDLIFYRLVLSMQLLFYGAAITGRLMRPPAKSNPVVSVPYAFCLLNWATVIGFLRFVLGRQRATWQKAQV